MLEEKHHVYAALDRPDVEVLYEVEWCRGEARMRTLPQDGSYEYNVQYRQPGELSSHLDTFPAEKVRADTVDRSTGRA